METQPASPIPVYQIDDESDDDKPAEDNSDDDRNSESPEPATPK